MTVLFIGQTKECHKGQVSIPYDKTGRLSAKVFLLPFLLIQVTFYLSAANSRKDGLLSNFILTLSQMINFRLPN